MYSTEHLKIAFREPRKIFWEGVSLLNRNILGRDASPFTERDWDNLLLLDACRYDLFEECFRERESFPGELDHTYSVASTTGEFIRRTFRDQTFPDIVCVTSTPKYTKEESLTGRSMDDVFHEIVHVWKDNWDDEHRVVLPEVMTNRVLEIAEEYPNKRIFAHYLPPHTPFIGETGQQMPHRYLTPHGGGEDGAPNVWDALKRGEYSESRVWRAYKENLELTLPSVERALYTLDGKTAVTSDHGNAFGKWYDVGYVGHGAHRHITSLIKVPWLEYQDGNRKTITQGTTDAASQVDVDETVVSNRLRDLGYAE